MAASREAMPLRLWSNTLGRRWVREPGETLEAGLAEARERRSGEIRSIRRWREGPKEAEAQEGTGSRSI